MEWLLQLSGSQKVLLPIITHRKDRLHLVGKYHIDVVEVALLLSGHYV